MHMDRVCEARRRLAQAAALASQRDPGCSHLLTDDAARADLGLSHHNQYVAAWPNSQTAAPRFYDHSREGPIHEQSWQTLGSEMKLRESSLSATHSQASHINRTCYDC
ncbi:hypothetical protein BsWGS_06918 [Bradybaena similaris]